MYKLCTNCNETKPVTDFHKQKGKSDGLRSWCKVCRSTKESPKYQEQRNEYNKQWNEDNKDWFHQHYLDNKSKHNNQTRSWRLRNVVKYRQGQRDYYQRNRQHRINRASHYAGIRRARLALCEINDFTIEQWNDLLSEYGFRCGYCGISAKLEKDHVLPLSKGGNHTKDNIIPACETCNRSKNKKTVYEFLEIQVGPGV